jgi:hypothetical protein
LGRVIHIGGEAGHDVARANDVEEFLRITGVRGKKPGTVGKNSFLSPR